MRKQKNGTILSNYDIIEIADKINLPLVGVYAKNRLPKKKIKGNFVINIGDFETGGSHWCAFCTNDNNVFYADSYGAQPPTAVDNYIKSVTGKQKYLINTTQLQSLGATYCGWFCIACLYCMANTKGPIKKRLEDFNEWLNPESGDLDDNYYKLLNFFNG